MDRVLSIPLSNYHPSVLMSTWHISKSFSSLFTGEHLETIGSFVVCLLSTTFTKTQIQLLTSWSHPDWKPDTVKEASQKKNLIFGRKKSVKGQLRGVCGFPRCSYVSYFPPIYFFPLKNKIVLCPSVCP